MYFAVALGGGKRAYSRIVNRTFLCKVNPVKTKCLKIIIILFNLKNGFIFNITIEVGNNIFWPKCS